MTGYCGTCRTGASRTHQSTARHRAAVRRASDGHLRGQDVRHVTAFVALRDWDRQFEPVEPSIETVERIDPRHRGLVVDYV